MASAGPSIGYDLEASQLADLNARRKFAMYGTGANAGCSDEVRIDQRQRVLVEPVSDGLGVGVGLIASGLIAIAGLAWVIGGLLSPFSSALVGGSSERVNSSPEIVGREKAEHLPIRSTDNDRPFGVAGAKQQTNSIGEHSRDGRHTTSVRTHLVDVPEQQTTGTGARDHHIRDIEPVPETRPKTIEGWTLREVVNDTAVVQGPNGTWRAARGDTVPGLGRIYSIFRWGDRLMVATSRGLISTP